MSELAVGDPAPAFDLPASGGRCVRSAALKGRTYLLYFYPKADTSGCTVQALGMEDALPELGKLGLEVIGISPDPMSAIDKFARKHGLTFPLASDTEKQAAAVYGTWVEKSMYGRKYMGMERSSFLVDRGGRIAAIWRKVKPAEHARQVMEAAARL